MNLFTFRERPETRGEGFQCSAFRWALQASRWAIGLVHQYKYGDEWHDSHTRVVEVSVHRPWLWGAYHAYYDGPHCVFSFGPVHVQWSGALRDGWCEKCHPKEGTPCYEGTCRHSYHQH
jgi:hypothetical protein